MPPSPSPRRSWRRSAVRWGLLGTAVLLALLVTRAAMLVGPAGSDRAAPSVPAVDEAAVAQRMSAVVRHRTVSLRTHGGEPCPDADPTQFEALHRTLRELYPRVHASLHREAVSTYSALYTWPGTEPELSPVLLAAHLDVVPVEPGTENEWTHPPFSGAIDGGFVWGREAIDDKLGVVGSLEAIEHLLAAVAKTRRTVLLALGHDEEVGGERGAAQIAALLEERGITPWFMLDEGGLVIEGALPGVEDPVALVGIAEKGYASVQLKVRAEGGHSTMPSGPSSITILGRALARLEDNEFSPRISAPTAAMLDHIAPHASFGMKIALANRWLFDPVLARVLTLDPSSNASVRTTTAVTKFDAGSADNVLASTSTAVVNFRILPGQTVEDVMAHVHHVVGDERVEASCFGHCWDPSPVSPLDEEPFVLLQQTISDVFEGAVVAPYLVVGGTDARYYHPLTEAGAFRFMPVFFSPADRTRLHGTDERMSVEALGTAVRFYMALLQAAAM